MCQMDLLLASHVRLWSKQGEIRHTFQDLTEYFSSIYRTTGCVAVFLSLLVWLGKLLSASEITVRGRTWQWRICPAMGLVSCCVVPHNCAGFLLSCMLWWINCVLHCCVCQAAEAWSLWVEGEQHWYLYLSAAQGQCFQHTMVLSF